MTDASAGRVKEAMAVFVPSAPSPLPGNDCSQGCSTGSRMFTAGRTLAAEVTALTEQVRALTANEDKIADFFWKERGDLGFQGDVEGRSPVSSALLLMRSAHEFQKRAVSAESAVTALTARLAVVEAQWIAQRDEKERAWAEVGALKTALAALTKGPKE